ncbi:MAG: GNAT family protein [Gammaproteobacteria bacterium]
MLKVNRLAITCDVDNVRSKKIPEQLGYRLESTMRANRINLISGEVTDTLVYARNDLINLPELKVAWKNGNA